MFPGFPGHPAALSTTDEPVVPSLSYEDKERYSTMINSGSHLEKDDISTSDGPSTTKGGDSIAPEGDQVRRRRHRFKGILSLVIVGPLLLAIAIGIPVGILKSRASNQRLNALQGEGVKGGNGNGNGNETKGEESRPITGGDGATVYTEDGSTFIYKNSFGGFWVHDPNNPVHDGARPNSWTPALNETWDFSHDKIFGVNLGGLFVLEPFITPALYQKYPGAVDEWTLSTLMAADTAGGGLNQLEDHYNTFITEQDIAEIAGAGLNWVRVPLPFWAIETWPGEPFLAKTSWKYFVRLLGWCRKYGLRVNLDLHTIPGSQNGYNHSGRSGQINFMQGTMGLANAQRALNYIRIITEFISQPEWKNVVQFFGILNEPIMPQIGIPQLQSFYVEAHRLVRSITGYGSGNGPYIGIHDGFGGPGPWANFMRGADRVVLDVHPYFAFGGGPANDPIATGIGPDAGGVWPERACQNWNNLLGTARTTYGISVAGEWSNGWNDCGLFLNGIEGTPTYGGNCEDWQNSANWDAATKAGLMHFALASMEALDSWFFWTWKIGNSTRGIVESPLWSYQHGLQGGWMPTDPRVAAGTCAPLGVQMTPTPNYASWMKGGDGAGAPTNVDQLTWPPPYIVNGGPAAQLPLYTATATPVTLPPPLATAPTTGNEIDFGSGWFNQGDKALAPALIDGCEYPNPWDNTQHGAFVNTPACRPQ
ncbi:hypothetical protein D9611_003606 [Ephemerocybe angulata]|uniref:glucan 1,3-beta-glucosidase n=1 Tax=Ephemerocybe angulata TaxID=980116 RepID=A0A8H5B577_9AGAR|nr:hypothetical protein D9611_003606 [Tulosesus angulatus]